MKSSVFIRKPYRIQLCILSLFLFAIIYAYCTRPILIGAIVPIKTPLGNEQNLFIRYYRDQHPRVGLRPVKFIIENNASTEEEIKSAYGRMVKQGVVSIIGGVLCQEGRWLSEQSRVTGVPTIGLSATSSELSGRKDGFFRVVPTNDMQASTVADYFNQMGSQRLTIVMSTANQAYANPFIRIIQKEFMGDTVTIPYSAMDETIFKILSTKPDSIFCILPAKDVMKIIVSIKEKRPDIRIATSSWGSSEILSLYTAPSLSDVIFFVDSSEVAGKTYNAEFEGFEERYGMETTRASHYASSVCHVLYGALSEAGDNREALMDYLNTPRSYDTAYGKVPMDEFGDSVIGGITVMATQDGKGETEETIK